MAANSSLVTLPAETSFLHGLADIVLQKHQSDAPCAPQPWVLLPTRRSCQAFERAFWQQAGRKTVLLPTIMPLGDIDVSALSQLAAQGQTALSLPKPPMSDLQRTMLLMRPWLHYAMSQTGQEHMTWQSMQQALQELLLLYDACEEHAVNAMSWEQLIPSSLAEHVREHSMLLGIIAEHWPNMQKETGRISFAEYRNQLLALTTQLLKSSAPNFPIIAAGSTGTIPATAALLHTIANLDQGLVVLPAYDVSLGIESEVAPDHPQSNLRQFSAGSAVHLHGESAPRTNTLRAIWEADAPIDACALSHVHSIGCETSRDQNKIAFLLIKQAVLEGKKVGVITPNMQTLAQLAQFCEAEEMHCSSAASKHLGQTAQGVLWQQSIEYVVDPENAVKLLALLRQVADLQGEGASALRESINALEMGLLRDYPVTGGIQGMVHEALRRKKLPQESIELLQWLSDALAPLFVLFERSAQGNKEVSFAHLVSAHKESFERLNAAAEMQSEGFADWCNALEQHAASCGTIDPNFYPLFVEESLRRESVHQPLHVDAPIQFLTPIEARLLQFDRVLILDMNEGDWPSETRDTLWLNDTLREALSLPTRADQAGRMAHDIWMQLHQNEVFLLRPERVGGAPTTPSRFWNRIMLALHRAGEANRVVEQTAKWKGWAYTYFEMADAKEPAMPQPMPPVHALPTSLSITQYETLQRDPYAIYAKEVLRLNPLDEIGQLPDARLYGILVHRVMERVCHATYQEKQTLDATCIERAIADVFAHYKTMPIIQSVWRWRLDAVAPWLLEHLQSRASLIRDAQAELKVEKNVAGITLRGRVDRVEYSSALYALADYKTGSIPTAKEFLLGYASQLPLAALALEADQLQDAYYVKVGTRPDLCETLSLRDKAKDEETWVATLHSYAQWLKDWNTYLLSGEGMFLAVPRPDYAPNFNRYAHLERLEEWNYLRQESSSSESASAAA